ncbi:hypothetical protein SLEP1_g8936 [Rubroshorea leprosula]|uniref:Uncharacterized protein n=1 Tax=Rubroshorea leprosula TaxID=152421 RepID=A0AAV5ID53_9ROSI|nr:hypothetical protein SLEP1_g8936 [Rubroshorea leprosula]
MFSFNTVCLALTPQQNPLKVPTLIAATKIIAKGSSHFPDHLLDFK